MKKIPANISCESFYFPSSINGTTCKFTYKVARWRSGNFSDYSYTQRSRVRLPPGPLSSNNLEQVIYTCGAQANSAFRPSERLGNGRSLIALPCLLLMLVSTPLRIVNRCCSAWSYCLCGVIECLQIRLEKAH